MRKSTACVRLAARWLLTVTSLAAVASPRLARAQSALLNRDQNVVFDDDLLNADVATPSGERVFSSHLPPARVQLIRPRTNFLPELYKSIEYI